MITNIFERITLDEITKKHPGISRQFGFKANSSCSHAIFVLNESLKFIKKKKKRAVVTFIDASKAFDKINRSILWATLFHKIGFKLTNILMNYYKISRAFVLKDGFKSELFVTTTGVKQGGPVSSLLFALYIEDLVTELDNSEIGLKIGNMTINIILYADDGLNLKHQKRNARDAQTN